MATRKTEAKIVVSVEDQGSPALARIQARFDAMNAPIARLQTMLARPLAMAGVGRLTGSLGRLHGAMERVPFAGSLFAAGGMALATKSLVDNSVAAHDALGRIQDLSKAYKISGDALQVYSEIGADSGVVVEDIAKSIGFLQQRIAGARGGDKADIKILAGVGINTADLKGDVGTILAKISDVFKASTKDTDDALKVDYAKQAMGKAGVALIPMLEEGGARYAEVFKKMTDEGRLFTATQREGADQVGDAWDASMRRIDGLRKTIGLAMSPMLDAMTQSIDRLMTGNARAEIIETFRRLGQTIAEEAPKFIEKIPAIVSGLGDIFRSIRDIGAFVGWDKLVLGGILFIASPFIAATISMAGALVGVGVALAGVTVRLAVMGGAAAMSAINGIRGIALAMRIMGLSAAASWAMALGPIFLIGAALAAVAYLIYSKWGGITAFFGGVWEGFTTALAPVAAAFEPVLSVLSAVTGWVGSLFGATKEGEQGFASWASAGVMAGTALARIFKALLAPILLVIDAIKLVGATASFVGGNGFNFESSTAKLFGGSGQPQPQGAALPAGQIAGGRSEFSGKLEITLDGQGRPQVSKVESNNNNIEVSASAGSMFAVGA
ncbi:MAG: hypothetical protein Q8N13_11175 [Acidovorax sp.]|nr:hypothetical protein [Acidovorax sp.]